MTEIQEIRERLDQIEGSIEHRPGDAVTELATVTPTIGDVIADRQIHAQQLMRNEDFAGAAHLHVENSLLFQRSASLLLELREQIRRRR